jgi:hypothetical protein
MLVELAAAGAIEVLVLAANKQPRHRGHAERMALLLAQMAHHEDLLKLIVAASAGTTAQVQLDSPAAADSRQETVALDESLSPAASVHSSDAGQDCASDCEYEHVEGASQADADVHRAL